MEGNCSFLPTVPATALAEIQRSFLPTNSLRTNRTSNFHIRENDWDYSVEALKIPWIYMVALLENFLISCLDF
ncbi:hypothetical protein D8674_003058 [Pyrus ussuriensis x Pyrus communis]|uniref:Uncharacterized protein n=1 Tax=Pyrus ussuriensis x Pyrus communis TaxID=2448454 RepID=A0A5N5FGP3_9ROSA|nr:hypothetical protein D8674_003058 [Pyrus ussuriensis x Pyrus communis]